MMNKLISIQKDLKVLKTQFNKFGNYAYRSSEDILLALKPLLVKHDCVLVISDKIHSMGENVIYIESIADLDCDEKHFVASSFARDPLTQKGMSAPQCTNSASSFARKQALSGLFLLDDTATSIPSKEEQEEADTVIKEQEQEQKEQSEKKINDILDSAKKSIDGALSEGELKSVFAALYREARKSGDNVARQVEQFYKDKKETFK